MLNFHLGPWRKVSGSVKCCARSNFRILFNPEPQGSKWALCPSERAAEAKHVHFQHFFLPSRTRLEGGPWDPAQGRRKLSLRCSDFGDSCLEIFVWGSMLHQFLINNHSNIERGIIAVCSFRRPFGAMRKDKKGRRHARSALQYNIWSRIGPYICRIFCNL